MPSYYLNQDLGRENSSVSKKDVLDYKKSHWKGSKIYQFSHSATQIFLCCPTMVVEISEDFEPPSKKFLAMSLQR